MRIRRFTARDMTEALKLVRQTLGPDAVILEAKGVREGQGPRNGVVVMAAVDRHPDQPANIASTPDERPSAPRPVPTGPAAEGPRLAARPPQRRSDGEAVRLAEEVKRLQGRVFYLNRLVTSDHFSAIPIPQRQLYLDLIDAEVDSNLAFAILREVAGAHPTDIVSGPQLEPVKARLAHIVPRCLPIPERKGRRVVVLVGPPGSGKTTVAASLAGRCVRRGRQPGLISLDTFRAGGQAGLGQYARALEVPFASVFEATDLLAVAQGDLASCDLLIVDTPGLTLVEREAVRLIRDVQLSLREPEVHAVLAADSKVAEAAESLNLLGNFKLSSLIFTRLDVTMSFGGMLSLSLKTKLPVSHGHWGRRVLEDFRDASPEELISLVLDQCTAGWEETVR